VLDFGQDADARAGNPVHQWGAEGKTRPLRPNQVVTAMYECGEEIVDCELSAADLLLLKNRFPKERVSLGLSVQSSRIDPPREKVVFMTDHPLPLPQTPGLK
jgi:hypothetical protein